MEFLMKARRAASVLGVLIGFLVVLIGTIIVELVYGFFLSTYNATGGLNSTLTNGSGTSGVATAINSFVTTTNSVLGLLAIVPLVMIAGLVIYLIVSGFGRGGE